MSPAGLPGLVYRSVYSLVLVSSFCIAMSANRDISAEAMRAEDRLDVLEAVAGERRDLRHRGICQSKPHNGGSSQVVERHIADASLRKPVGGESVTPDGSSNPLMRWLAQGGPDNAFAEYTNR